jgi:hypothetical protein
MWKHNHRTIPRGLLTKKENFVVWLNQIQITEHHCLLQDIFVVIHDTTNDATKRSK